MNRLARRTPARRLLASGTALRRQAGQGMTEYIIIVALIAVAAIGIYTLFGQTIRNQTAGLALEMSGQDAATAIGNARWRCGCLDRCRTPRNGRWRASWASDQSAHGAAMAQRRAPDVAFAYARLGSIGAQLAGRD